MDVNAVLFGKEGTGGGEQNGGSLSKEECQNRLNEAGASTAAAKVTKRRIVQSRMVAVVAVKGADGRGGGQSGRESSSPARNAYCEVKCYRMRLNNNKTFHK